VDPLVKPVFSFLGVTDLVFVWVEGTAIGGESRGHAIAEAERQIASLRVS